MGRMILSICAVVVAALLCSGEAASQAKQNRPQAEETQAQPSAPPEQREEAEHYRNPCGYDNTREDSDLCAQWRSANAAVSTFEWIRSLYWLNLVEAFGIVISLSLSALAAIAGLRAARAAEVQLAAADRPHVMYEAGGMTSLKWFPVPNSFGVFFRWTNYGRGPCWTREYGVAAYCGPVGKVPEIKREDFNPHAIAWPMAPTGHWEIFADYPRTIGMPHDALMAVAMDQRALWIALYIKYIDSDDRPGESRVVLRYEAENDRLIPVSHPFTTQKDAK